MKLGGGLFFSFLRIFFEFAFVFVFSFLFSVVGNVVFFFWVWTGSILYVGIYVEEYFIFYRRKF